MYEGAHLSTRGLVGRFEQEVEGRWDAERLHDVPHVQGDFWEHLKVDAFAASKRAISIHNNSIN